MTLTPDYPRPHPVQFQGSRLAAAVLRLLGWQIHFDGLPALQGVLIVYPHTSNWDFPVMMLAKWTLGIPVSFWCKDSLFRIPLFGPWLRWIGGVPVQRTASRGMTRQAVDLLEQHRREGSYCWLGLAPEGTRKLLPGWRSGFYRTAQGADVPLCLVRVDYARRDIRACDFIRLAGDEKADMQRIVAVYEGVQGCVPGRAAPIRLLDASVDRTDTITK